MNVKILSWILLAWISFNTWVDYLQIPGVDFYHYWGVAKAQQLTPSPLNSPYIAPDTYANVLNQYAETTEDKRLRDANAYRRTLDLTGTPLLYTFFAILPENYTRAIVSFRFFQLILFISAILLIGVLQNCPDNFLMLALVLSATFLPVVMDLRVGNLNTIQLFLIVISTLLVDRANCHHSRQRLHSGLIAACLFIFITLLKPNLILTVLTLSISFLVKYGFPKLTVLIPASMAFSALIILLTSVFLGSSQVWLDWYALVSNRDRLAYALIAGNYSTPLLISHHYNLDIYAAVAAVAAFLAISLGGVILMSAFKRGLAVGKSFKVVLDIFRDPGLAVSIAMTVTIALSPLVWVHYYTLLLLPILWTMDPRHYCKKANWLSLLAIASSGGIILQILLSLRIALSPELHATNFILGWVFIWARILFIVLNLPDKNSDKAELTAA